MVLLHEEMYFPAVKRIYRNVSHLLEIVGCRVVHNSNWQQHIHPDTDRIGMSPTLATLYTNGDIEVPAKFSEDLSDITHEAIHYILGASTLCDERNDACGAEHLQKNL